MPDNMSLCRRLGDRELIAGLKRLRAQESKNLAAIIAHLAEVDRRRLAVAAGFPSLFSFCLRELCYSEAEAAWRIYAARAVRRFPAILSFIESDGLPMTAVVALAPHMTEENHIALLERARGKTKFELQRMIAELAPKRDAVDMVRRFPDTVPASISSECQEFYLSASGEARAPVLTSPAAPRPKDLLVPTAPERVRFAFTGGEALLRLLRRAQDVLKHKYPAGDLECIFEEALEALLDKKDPERKLRAKEGKGRTVPVDISAWIGTGHPDSRRIPQAVKDAVWRRDGGQCVFVGPNGGRCPERGGLEFDHIVPFALGGASNNPKNIRLLCKAHNLLMARRVFGEDVIRRQAGL